VSLQRPSGGRDLAEDLEDLLDPKWKGKLGIEQETDWLAACWRSREPGTKLFKEIVAKNAFGAQGHSCPQLVVWQCAR